MLYNLLISYSDTYSFLNFFSFLTVRTGLAVITSMVIVFLIGDNFINYFSAKKITNPIRVDGPENHLIKKIGTPTMGGVLILIGLFSGVFLWADLYNPYNWLLIFITLSFGVLGAFDDYKKISNNNSKGISFRSKLIILIISLSPLPALTGLAPLTLTWGSAPCLIPRTNGRNQMRHHPQCSLGKTNVTL